MPLVTIVFGALAKEFINGDEKAPQDVRNQVQHLTLYLVYIAIGSFLTTMISTWGFDVVGERITHELQERYLSSVLQQNIAYFDVLGTGELTSSMDHDMQLIQAGLSQKVSYIISGISGFGAAIIFAFMQNRRFASIMISQPLALVTWVGVMGYFLSITQKRGLRQYAKADNLAQEVLNAMRNVLAYRSQERYSKKFFDTLQCPAALEFRERFIFGFIVAGSFTTLHWGNGLGFWQANRLFHQGVCTVSEVLVILYAAMVAGGMLCQALPFVVDITLANGAARRVFSVIERVSPINPMNKMGIIPSSIGEIQFEDVSFTYPSQPERTVLEGVSFTVPPGRTMALVGPSGSGKSTVFAILERLYLPFNGTITLGNEPLENINVAWLRSQIGYVGQDITLFDASIHDNIANGLSIAENENKTLEESAVRSIVIQAAEKAQIHSFVMDLPHGYDTVIGANGSSLSGGQRQRIAIARAIVSQPAILLLDEATAALDSQSEKEVQEALNEAASGRTTMIIAHRLSTVQNADIILVLKDGHIVDQGSHAGLMKTSTTYQELVRHQAFRSDDRPVKNLNCKLPYSEKDVEELDDLSVPVDGVKLPEGAPVLALRPSNGAKHVWHLNKPELSYTIAGVVFSIFAGLSYPIQAIFFGNGVISIINPALSTGGHNVQFWALVYLIHGIVVFVTGVSGTSVGLAAESIVMLATGIIVGCIFGWELGLVSTAAVPLVALSGFLQYYIVSQVQKHVKRDTNAATIAHEAFSAIKTVTVLGMQRTILEAFRKEIRRESQGRYWVISAVIYACTPMLRVLSIAFVFWYGGTRLIATGEYSIQQFFICFAATVWGSQSAAALFAHAPDLAGAYAAANRLEYLMQPSGSQCSKKQDKVPRPAPGTVEDLALQRVRLKYPARSSHMALDDVSFDVPEGAFIALVGTTGSGKSSVINLVERFYTAESGKIILSEKDIREYDQDSYRQYLALVDQNPCLVGEDMRECLQSDERVISDDEILAALKGVGLADFVLSLAQGLSTPVLANGSTLSGGQRQRMAIAKALLWEPKILLLDEATSALDTASEMLVQEALKHAMKGRSTIAVAHRLKTIVDASKILLFESGRIVEQGTHDQLMQLRGKYWQMARLQMQMEGED
ncbi:hypothetical protein PENANT_c015G09551 [Penicillium antarcticum]|uniref:ABC transporter n=1 Tax=Penicillium antarcticum TaxID=416450 RepID=A0A1V6Q4B5_9EURO|nr:hypothetical protein PENANT_c015G09551 [Penicillium antarcticum]